MTSKKVSKKKTVAKRNATSSKVATRSPVSSAAKSKKSTSQVGTDYAASVQTPKSSEPYTANNGGKFALAASLLALVLAVYAVYEVTIKTQVTDVKVTGFNDRLNSIVSEQQSLKLGLDSQGTRSKEQIKAFDTNLNTMQTSIADLQLLAQASVDDIKANLGESVARWKLDEVQSLLTRVNQVYQLTGSQPQAIAGLELAQSSLATIDNPRLVAVNTALAEDILRVKSDRSVDISSIHDRLVGMDSMMSELVLAEDARAKDEMDTDVQSDGAPSPDAQEDGIFEAGKTLFSDIGNLVKHKNLDAPLQPSLDEHARFVVYESLRLEMQAAMVALLRRDNMSYQSQLVLANETLNTYFDTEAMSTQTVIDQLQVLQSYDVSLNAQAISRALTALNRVMTVEN